ncbi:hypothetical protein ACFL5V_11030 [Fibrobacterota bacterium]
MNYSLSLSLILFLGLFLCAAADESGDKGGTAQEEAQTPVKPEKIAADHNIPVDSVNELKTSFNIGYGGVSHALSLAMKTGKTVEDILRMKTEEKKGWGVIARELEQKPGQAYKLSDPALEGGPANLREEKVQRKMEMAQEKAERKNSKRHGKK